MDSETVALEAWQPGAPADTAPDLSLNTDVDLGAASTPDPTHDDDFDMGYDDDDDDDDSFYGPRYCPGPDHCEDNELYQEGGLHPVQIEDCIEGRYLIVHKLGSGGSATVWLARDKVEDRYVALKIVTANMSHCAEAEAAVYKKLHDSLPEDVREEFILPLYDTFWIEGPNGRHMCLATGISGPSLASFRQVKRMKIRADLVNVVAAQIAEGLSHLHGVGLVYGDLSAGNIAFTMPNLDHFSVKDLYNIFGAPDGFEVHTADEEDEDWGKIHAPDFVYRPLDFTARIPIGLLQPAIKFIDFGASHFANATDLDKGWGYTLSYADPECLYYDKPTSQDSDRWALACIFFELRSAMELVPMNGDGVWAEIVARIGPKPKEWDEAENEEDDADPSHAEYHDSVEADAVGDDEKSNGDQEPPASNDTAGNDDDARSVDGMELEDETMERTTAEQEDSPVHSEVTAPAWSFFPTRLHELIRLHLMQRVESLMKKLGIDTWKQYCVEMLGSVTPWVQRAPSHEPAPSSPTPTAPEMPMPTRRFRPPFFRHRGDDPTLHGQIANIGNHHPWHGLTIEQRRERLEKWNADLEEQNRVDTSDKGLDRGPPPPDKLSSEEAADLEDLLTKLLTWQRSDRATLESIREHPWLTKAYAPCGSELWLQPYYRGATYAGPDEQFI